MEDYILCKSKDGTALEVDIEDDGTVGLETLKSVFGEKAVGLTLTPQLVERDLCEYQIRRFWNQRMGGELQIECTVCHLDKEIHQV